MVVSGSPVQRAEVEAELSVKVPRQAAEGAMAAGSVLAGTAAFAVDFVPGALWQMLHEGSTEGRQCWISVMAQLSGNWECRQVVGLLTSQASDQCAR